MIPTNKLITFQLGAVLLFISLGFALVGFLGFLLLNFAAKTLPVSAAFVYLLWRALDFSVFQTFILGGICFCSGIFNTLFQLDLSLYKMVFISITFAILFYVFVVFQLIDDGIVLKTIG